MITGAARYVQLSRDLRHLLNGEWVTHILVALSLGSLYYHELHGAIQGMTTWDPWTGTEHEIQSRALSRTLGRMRTAGLVDRTVVRPFPRTVAYSLTPAAIELLDSGRPLVEWAEKHLDLIERMQKARLEQKRRLSGWDDSEPLEDH
ncbi:winged helix-turn-helix transcriptional regulator [Actinocrispum wychmicini]|uniref:HxlR family transcriptional regulator n=1 Tax=Actinocrispum wychmicini TaxID=1213861 RepID=A0A4V2S4V5_9PSEU|nr:helix-turn-helix domain-containing protein [Actinocrispum wychmicini]TCO49650.1 HxlR family transcriptional regulator [Actinocrispum wychmicini]